MVQLERQPAGISHQEPALRTPRTGCPWDLEQHFATIAPYTIEEAYEVVDAISRGDLDDLRDELGDLLLQVVFHARMAQEADQRIGPSGRSRPRRAGISRRHGRPWRHCPGC